MPFWMAIFLVVWSAVSVLLAVVVGAFLGYCRETRANPVAQLRSVAFPPMEDVIQKRDDAVKGFYE